MKNRKSTVLALLGLVALSSPSHGGKLFQKIKEKRKDGKGVLALKDKVVGTFQNSPDLTNLAKAVADQTGATDAVQTVIDTSKDLANKTGVSQQSMDVIKDQVINVAKGGEVDGSALTEAATQEALNRLEIQENEENIKENEENIKENEEKIEASQEAIEKIQDKLGMKEQSSDDESQSEASTDMKTQI